VDTTGKELLSSKTVSGRVFGETYAANAPPIDGSNPDSPAKSITITSGENFITFVYTKKGDLSYTVRYVDTTGKELLSSKTVSGRVFGETYAENAPPIDGYNPDSPSKSITITSGENLITFVYTPKTYTVIFVDWDEAVLKTQTEVIHGAGADAPENPTRSGYLFKEWDIAFDNVTSDLTVTALYTAAPVSGGSGSSPKPPPKVVIIEEEPPQTTFIEDHVAYIIGYPDGDVRPGSNITRAEVATVFFRLLTDSFREQNWTQKNPYQDINMGNWYNNAVSVMSAVGTVNGYPDGTFKPNGAITRAELATIAARFAREMKMDGENSVSFSDTAGHWAGENINYAARLGWVNGYPDGTFRPNQPITRAEFMTLANRMLKRVPELVEGLLVEKMRNWIDNSNKTSWYYLAVQEATNSHESESKKNRVVQGLHFEFERWVELIENRDWAAYEKNWAYAYTDDSIKGSEDGDEWVFRGALK
jgi:hypothetical protein